MNKWISIHDKLPKIDKNVLIYYPYWKGDEIHVARLDCDCLSFDICGEFNINVNSVTHWMPLPEPPVILIKGGDYT